MTRSFFRTLSLLTCLALMTFGMGCDDDSDSTTSSDTPNTTIDGDDADNVANDDSGGATTGAGMTCELDPPSSSEVTTCDPAACACGFNLETVTGKVVDSSGAPIESAMAQVCVRGVDDAMACLNPVPTNAEGVFSMSVPVDKTCVAEAVMRITDTNVSRSTSYCSYTKDTLPDAVYADGAMDLTAAPVTLIDTIAATTMPAYEIDEDGEEDWSKTYTVGFEGGLEIDVIPNNYFNSAQGMAPMAAVWIDDVSTLCGSEAIAGAPGAWAISPEGDVFRSSFAARIPAPELADGTSVKLYIQGGIGSHLYEGEGEKGEECREGAWTHFGCAEVQNGVITLEGANGIPAIGWLAYVPQ
jgi:hypothetical protein